MRYSIFYSMHNANAEKDIPLSLLQSSARAVQPFGCHQIVTKTSAKRTKIEQIQTIEIVAILRLAKGFS
jgi:hypothetical protein